MTLQPCPCPFCGGINIVREGYHLCCWACGAAGPDADTGDEESLIEAWNLRAALASQAQPEQPKQDSVHLSGVSGEAATAQPVAWARQRFICDRDGRPIGTDDPELAWGDEPPDDSDWLPLYGSAEESVAALPVQQELAYLRQEAKKAAVAMAQHMPHRKETHDLFAALTGEGTPPPDGLRLLPVEPTPEMVWAGNSLIRYDLDLNGLQTSAAGVWRAMVAALNPPSPKSPPADQGEQHHG